AGLKGAVADQIARVRAALESSSVPTAQSRPEGYSFCILSSGQRPDKLERLIASIHNLRLENVEILVGGQLTNVPNGVQAIDFGASARAGRTGKIRNQLARRARFRHLVFCSESIVLNEGFASGMARLADTCEAMAGRILNPDGTRYIDWAASGGTAAPLLLHYWQTDPEVLLPDAFCVVRAGVMDRIAWDENLGTGDRPEVDF